MPFVSFVSFGLDLVMAPRNFRANKEFKPCVVVHAHPTPWVAEVGGPQLTVQPGQVSNLTKPCLKRKNKKELGMRLRVKFPI